MSKKNKSPKGFAPGRERDSDETQAHVRPVDTHNDPGDGRTECQTCGKWVFECIHSCKRVPVTPPAWNRKLDELVEKWHTSPTDDGPLHEFLGMSWEEYGAWTKHATIPARWLR